MNYKVIPSVLTGALVVLMLGSIVAGAAIFRPFEAQAQTTTDPACVPGTVCTSLASDCGTSSTVDAAHVPGTTKTWVVFDCSSKNAGYAVEVTDDGQTQTVSTPQKVTDGYPVDMFVTASSSGKVLVMATTEGTNEESDDDDHIVVSNCSTGGECTTSEQNPDNPLPPGTTETFASGLHTSESSCGESSCTKDDDNIYDPCFGDVDTCAGPAIVVDDETADSHGWDIISGTHWISGNPSGTGFASEDSKIYNFYTTFDVPSGSSSPSLSVSVLADDETTVQLNGHLIGTSTGGQNPPETASTTDESFFEIGGQNTLLFNVSNTDDPMGLDYEATLTYVPSGPEPTALPNYENNQIQSLGFNPFSSNAQIIPVHPTPDIACLQHPAGAYGSTTETVYVVWEDNCVVPNNYEIMFGVSIDGGNSWSPPINLSQSPGESRDPKVAANGDNIFVTWEDGTSSNREILISRSTDGGEHFNGGTDQSPAGDPLNLSNTPRASTAHEIALDGSNFYVVWADKSTGNGDIYLKRSAAGAGGDIVKAPIQKIEAIAHATFDPDIDAKGNILDIVWSDESGTSTKHKEALFVQSTNGGTTFARAIDVSNTKGESVRPLVSITSDNNKRFVAWLDSEPKFPAGSYRIFAAMSADGVRFSPPAVYSGPLTAGGAAKALSEIAYDLADKICAWDPHCSRCQGDTYEYGNGDYSYGAGAPLAGTGWLW